MRLVLLAIARIENSVSTFRPSIILCHTASKMSKPLIVDSGALNHMISDTNLIKGIEPIHGHVMIANGDKILI